MVSSTPQDTRWVWPYWASKVLGLPVHVFFQDEVALSIYEIPVAIWEQDTKKYSRRWLGSGDCLCRVRLHPSVSLHSRKVDSSIDQQSNWELFCRKMQALGCKGFLSRTENKGIGSLTSTRWLEGTPSTTCVYAHLTVIWSHWKWSYKSVRSNQSGLVWVGLGEETK